MKKLTKENKFNHIQSILKYDKPIDDEEKKEFEYYKTLTLNDFEDDTDEDLKENNMFLKEVKKAQNKYKDNNKKDKLISMRVNTNIINNIKKISSDIGLNYQSYIGVLLDQASKGNIKLKIEQK